MSTTTVFESPTALGAKLITISTTITNTSGAYTDTISDERLTASMKAIKLELGDPSVFDAVINVAVNNGSLTISCASVTGTSTAVISVLKTCDDPTAITTTEFDVLANRIGDLDDLETTAKTDLVSAVNEVVGNLATQDGTITFESGFTNNSTTEPTSLKKSGNVVCCNLNAKFTGNVNAWTKLCTLSFVPPKTFFTVGLLNNTYVSTIRVGEDGSIMLSISGSNGNVFQGSFAFIVD